MAKLAAVLSDGDDATIDAALGSLVAERLKIAHGEIEPFDWWPLPQLGGPRDELRFQFIGGVHENPTKLAFRIAGATIPTTLMVIIIGMSGLYRQHGETECLVRARETTEKHLTMLKGMHALQGRMTLELDRSFRSILEAGDAAERRCRSMLDGFHYKVTVPPKFTFDVTMGADVGGPKI